MEPSGRRFPVAIRYLMASCAASDLADFLLGKVLVREPRGFGDWRIWTSQANAVPTANSVKEGPGSSGDEVRLWNSRGR